MTAHFGRLAQTAGISMCGAQDPLMITSNGGSDVARISIPENQTAVTTVTASGGTPPYEFRASSGPSEPDGGLFTMDTATGALEFVTAPDYENPTDSGGDNIYVLRVEVEDQSRSYQYDVQVIVVTVTDEEEPGAADRAALETLYHATGGPNWTNNTNWLSDSPLSEWYGVAIDGDGRVMALDLGFNGLAGTIPVELGDLPHLVSLGLPNNRTLTGPIPAALGNLNRLRSLNLGGNDLTGPIPEALANLKSLQELVLYDNALTGPIPEWLGDHVHPRDAESRRQRADRNHPDLVGKLD